MNFRANMASLQTLSDDYYHHRISFAEYRNERSQLLKLIDEELNGVKNLNQVINKEEKIHETLINKALSFLKTDKVKESN